ncbi:T9SS type A sorting domain-containing protein [Kordia sp.]|uniref:T9SS type A sorting domain-containing protein n=1 Tax=Kordia sp. TaxID=1965332 RepID=UPI003D6B5689
MIMFFFGTYIGVSQILNQTANWPSSDWTLSGTYTAGGLLSDPTGTGTNFTWDDDAVGSFSVDNIQVTSPVINLTTAYGAGETWITISGDFLYRQLGGEILAIEIYDADAMTWSVAYTFIENTGTDYQTCSMPLAYTTPIINIAGYTATQLSGFQYRITYDDDDGWRWGFCFAPPTIASAMPPLCSSPVTLTATNIDGFSADLGWTEFGSAALWNIELVDVTAGGVPTGTATSIGVTNPFNLTGLVPTNDYVFYVQADCGSDGTSVWSEPFIFSTTIACPNPSALTATNILTTTADLSWTAGGSEALWDVEIVDITAGGTQTMTATVSGVTNPYNATGLTGNNAYEFYVRADCNPNGTSTWVGPYAFTTACATLTAPYSEDFENAGAVPTCWALGGDENWLFTNTGAGNHIGNNGMINGNTISGGYFAYVDDSVPNATNAQLDSPFVDVSGLTTPSLSFYELSNNEGNSNATLTVSVWDGIVWNIVGTYNTNTATGWEQKIIDLSGLTFTGPARARFSIADSGSFYDDIAIDDVTFDELPTCIDPSVLTASNIDGFSADLEWTANGTATLWNVELVDVTAGGVATGTATSSGVTSPFNQTGLTTTTDYEFYVQADCGVDGVSNWIGPFAFSTLVACSDPSALTATNILTTTADLSWVPGASETLWDVEIVDITAGGTQTMTTTASGVANLYNATGLTEGNTYEFYVRADCGVNGTSTWVGPYTFVTVCNVFTAPYSQDFENAGILPSCWMLGGNENWLFANTGAGSHIGNNGTLTGNTISGGYFAYVDDSTPEAINAQLDSPLVDVSGLTTPSLLFYLLSDNAGNANATLTVSVWDGAVWNVMGTYNTNTLAGWEQKVIDLSGLTFTGPAQARFSIADSGSFYDDVAIDDIIFQELQACPQASMLTATNITDTTADLGWTENGSAVLWDVELVDVTAGGTATGIPTATDVANPYTATGLVQDNDYEFYLRVNCGSTGLSIWAGPFAFRTLESCPRPSVLTATNITDTSVDLGWTENGSAVLWNVELVNITAGGTATGVATATGITNPYTATTLIQDNDYAFYVQASCGPVGLSTWVGPFAFRTLETCPRPSALNATAITQTTADLGWTDNGIATLWNIELVDITAGGTQTMTATASGVMNPYPISGLVEDNIYQYYVQADCGVDGVSAWVGPFTFITQYVAVAPSCSNGIFLDSGGMSSNHSDNENITYTICPDNPGGVVEVTFNAFNLEDDVISASCYDGLTLYDGADATAATIDPPGGGTIWCWDENSFPQGTGDLEGMSIVSTDASGCLTFVFTSDASVQRSGWEATVSCNTLTTISFGNGRAFTYFPNPVDNKLTLVAGKNIENVTIYNILGTQILTTTPNELTKEIDTSKLTTGAYFVSVTVDGVTDTIKVIKQ